MHRKEFIKICCISCLGGTALISLLEGCAGSNYFAQNTMANNQITIKKSEFIKVDKEKQSHRKYVLVKSDSLNFPICIFKISEDTYSALLMECTHRGCELQPAGDYLSCPCHGSEFTNRGIVQNPPAEENLKTFKTTTDNENIYVQL
ncbi:MAG: ubiquinol-cytochrome c reductase iron-sulfur subunit [Bacteroidia bacterium]